MYSTFGGSANLLHLRTVHCNISFIVAAYVYSVVKPMPRDGALVLLHLGIYGEVTTEHAYTPLCRSQTMDNPDGSETVAMPFGRGYIRQYEERMIEVHI